MVLRTYRVPEDLYALAAARAAEYGDSLSDIIRAALAAYALAETPDPEPEPAGPPVIRWGVFGAQ